MSALSVNSPLGPSAKKNNVAVYRISRQVSCLNLTTRSIKEFSKGTNKVSHKQPLWNKIY